MIPTPNKWWANGTMKPHSMCYFLRGTYGSSLQPLTYWNNKNKSNKKNNNLIGTCGS